MRSNKKNISTISFFSKKTKMENGEVISEEGGFYLEKKDDIKNLCYKKGDFTTTLLISRKTFQKLKSLTSGIILERASKETFSSMEDEYDEMDDYDRLYGNKYKDYKRLRSSYVSQRSKEPKIIAAFIYQEFIPS